MISLRTTAGLIFTVVKLQAEPGLAETRRKEHKNSPWCSIQYDLKQQIERIHLCGKCLQRL